MLLKYITLSIDRTMNSSIFQAKSILIFFQFLHEAIVGVCCGATVLDMLEGFFVLKIKLADQECDYYCYGL